MTEPLQLFLAFPKNILRPYKNKRKSTDSQDGWIVSCELGQHFHFLGTITNGGLRFAAPLINSLEIFVMML